MLLQALSLAIFAARFERLALELLCILAICFFSPAFDAAMKIVKVKKSAVDIARSTIQKDISANRNLDPSWPLHLSASFPL